MAAQGAKLRESNQQPTPLTAMPDIPYSAIPLVGRLVSALMAIKNRLMETVPVIDAQCIDVAMEGKAFMIFVSIYPTRRQAEFDRVTVDDCKLLDYVQDVDDMGLCRYNPRTSEAPSGSKEGNWIIPPEKRREKPVRIGFFILPDKPMKVAKIRLHSPEWLMSTTCKVDLT